jgi:hypothetical protein
MTSSGMLRRVALVRTDVSEELSASFIRVTRISELGTTLAVTSNRHENLKSYISLTEKSCVSNEVRNLFLYYSYLREILKSYICQMVYSR